MTGKTIALTVGLLALAGIGVAYAKKKKDQQTALPLDPNVIDALLQANGQAGKTNAGGLTPSTINTIAQVAGTGAKTVSQVLKAIDQAGVGKDIVSQAAQNGADLLGISNNAAQVAETVGHEVIEHGGSVTTALEKVAETVAANAPVVGGAAGAGAAGAGTAGAGAAGAETVTAGASTGIGSAGAGAVLASAAAIVICVAPIIAAILDPGEQPIKVPAGAGDTLEWDSVTGQWVPKGTAAGTVSAESVGNSIM